MLRLQAGKQADRSSQRHNGQVEFGSDPPRPRGPYKYEWMSWRFPPRLSRCRLVRPLLAFQGYGSVGHGDFGFGGVAVGVADFGEDLGGGQVADAVDVGESGPRGFDVGGDLGGGSSRGSHLYS